MRRTAHFLCGHQDQRTDGQVQILVLRSRDVGLVSVANPQRSTCVWPYDVWTFSPLQHDVAMPILIHEQIKRNTRNLHNRSATVWSSKIFLFFGCFLLSSTMQWLYGVMFRVRKKKPVSKWRTWLFVAAVAVWAIMWLLVETSTLDQSNQATAACP